MVDVGVDSGEGAPPSLVLRAGPDPRPSSTLRPTVAARQWEVARRLWAAVGVRVCYRAPGPAPAG